jgi:hypothetical protein
MQHKLGFANPNGVFLFKLKINVNRVIGIYEMSTGSSYEDDNFGFWFPTRSVKDELWKLVWILLNYWFESDFFPTNFSIFWWID